MVHHFDINTAYINAELKGKKMGQAPTYESDQPGTVYK